MADRFVGAVTGVVGAAGGLGGFFPPLLMATVKSLSGSYALGFILLATVAAVCLIVLASIDRHTPPDDNPARAEAIRNRRQPRLTGLLANATRSSASSLLAGPRRSSIADHRCVS